MVAELGLLAALAATGFIWVRYSLVIKPVNYSLAAVSVCVPYRFRLGFHAPRVLL
jgi:Mitochondrial pyruvate carriers